MIVQYYKLNLIPTGKDPVIVRCSQYDRDSRVIEFSLFNGNEPFALSDSYSVIVRGTKQDGTVFEYNCSVVDTNVVFSVKQQMTLFAGKYPCELRIIAGDEILGSANFYLYIEKSPVDEEAVPSESDLPAYEKLLLDVQSKNVSDWLEENISQETGYVIDTSLSVSGAAADAKAVGDEIQRLEAEIEGGESGGTTSISDELKQALLQLAQKAAYVDAGGQTYYQALYDALYSEAVLTSITAVYTQSGTVYTTDTLDSLKPDLTVTAHYDNGTSETVSTYELSGTLTVGTSAITVSYGSKTTTFNVTVTDAAGMRSVTYHLTGCTSSNTSTVIEDGSAYTATITAQNGYTLTGAVVSITMGGAEVTGAYSGGTISIPNVTGDLVITVTAVENIVLPSGYSRVEWISNKALNVLSSPTYINWTMPLDDELELQFDMIHNGGGGQAFRSSASAQTAVAFYSGKIYYDLNNVRAGMLAIRTNDFNTVRIGNHYVESVELGTSSVKETQADQGNVTWQWRNTSDDQEQHFKRIKGYHNGTLSLDLVPCTRDSDSAPGFYDLVGETFITGNRLTYAVGEVVS